LIERKNVNTLLFIYQTDNQYRATGNGQVKNISNNRQFKKSFYYYDQYSIFIHPVMLLFDHGHWRYQHYVVNLRNGNDRIHYQFSERNEERK